MTGDQPALAIYNLVRAVTHPYPGAFTYFRGRKLFIWAGQALAAPAGRPPDGPGLVTAALPGEGLLVATGDGHFLITQAQWEGEPEFLGPVVATWDHLVGERLRKGAPAGPQKGKNRFAPFTCNLFPCRKSCRHDMKNNRIGTP